MFYGNQLRSWLLALLIAIMVVVALRIIRGLIVRRALILSAKTKTKLDDLVTRLLHGTLFLFLLVLGVYAGSLALALPEQVRGLIDGGVIIAVLIQVALWANSIISFVIDRYKRDRIEQDPSSVTAVTTIGFIGKLALWSVVLLLALDNLGFNVTALVAGLGIGGIAVGLAVQGILSDLFASLSIVLDKPFEIGDSIAVGEFQGSVEYIGLKTTRVRSFSGEQLVFSNTDLTSSRIRNFKRMQERRVVFDVGVVYQTPYEKLAAIPSIIRGIIEQQEQTRFDRVHFRKYGDFSLNFEIVYYVLNPDFNLYMDIQQAINLTMFRRFEEEGINFAYPTRTLYVEGEGASGT
jgi:small-conductance mechanosensitive channel